MNLPLRKFYIKRALMHSMGEGGSWPSPQGALFFSVGVKLEHLKPTEEEMKEQLQGIISDGLAERKSTERGHFFKLLLPGQFWLTENP